MFNSLDNTDVTILNLLQSDAKLTNKEIAAQLNMSTTPIYERVKRLEKSGFIKKYVAVIDREAVGLSIVGFCNVSLKEHARAYIEKFEQQVNTFEEITECYHIAGMFDYLLKVIVPDMNSYQNFITNKLATLENIGRVQSSFVMTTIKHETALKVKKKDF